MNKSFKVIGIIAGLFLLLFLAAVIIIPMVIDPNDYKQEIEKAVRNATGRSFAIHGDIRLSFFPWIGVRVGEVSLGNAPQFSEEPMARIQETDVKVRLLPLLNKQVEVSTCLFKGMQLYLGKDASGKPNWADLLEREEQHPVPPVQGEQTQDSPSETRTIPLVSVSGVEIADARIIWDDRQSGRLFKADSINLDVVGFSFGEPFDLTLSLDLDATNPQIKAMLELAANVTLKLQQSQITCRNLTTTLDLEKFTSAPSPQNAAFSPLSGKISLAGDILANWGKGQIDLNKLHIATDLKGGMVPGEGMKATLAADIAVNWLLQTMNIAELKASAYTLDITGNIRGERIIEAPSLKGSLAVAPFSLKKLMKDLNLPPLKTKAPEALTALAATVDFQASPDKVSLSSLNIVLDKTRLNGTAQVSSLSRKRRLPSVMFDLHADALDVDGYMPKKNGEAPKPSPAPNTNSPVPQDEKPAGLPLDLLKSLDVTGRLRVGTLQVYGIQTSNILARLTAKNGRVTLAPFSFDVFQGSLHSNAVIDASRKIPLSTLVLNLKQLDLEQTLAAFMKKPVAGGTTALELDLSTTGHEYNQMLRKLNGKVSAAALNGFIRGFRLEPKRFDTKKGYNVPPEDVPNLTEFRRLGADFIIQDGLASTRNLNLKTNLANVDGKGSVDLADQKLDLSIDADLQVMTVPISIEGTFEKPRIRVDTTGMLMNTVKGVGSVLEKSMETGGDVGKGAVDVLKKGTEEILNIFGGQRK